MSIHMGENILEVNNLSHSFHRSGKDNIRAVNDVSFNIKYNEIFGLAGESGSGKSTVARCIMNIIRPSTGRIMYDGINITDKKEIKSHKKKLQCERQIIFQDSTSSLNRHMKVADIIAEPLRINNIFGSGKEERHYVIEMLEEAGLNESYADRKPYELSGGERQRVAIARAFGMKPKLLIADEPFASLDAGIQMQMVELFLHLKNEHDCAILFIAHDLLMIRFLCDKVAVMNDGKIVECGNTAEIFNAPSHPYTKKLIDAIPIPEVAEK